MSPFIHVSRLILLASTVLALTAHPSNAEPSHSTIRRVRFTDRLIAIALARGRCAPTFAALLERIERSDIIVSIERADCRCGGTAGTQFLTAAGGYRYVVVRLNIDTVHDEDVALLGHELAHVVELVDAPDVRDHEGYRSLYGTIGDRRGRQDQQVFETRAARVAGKAILSELRVRNPGVFATE